MKKFRTILLFAMIGVIFSIGIVLFMLLAGPEKIDLAGRSLPELLESGDLAPLIVIPILLVVVPLSLLPFLRAMGPGRIRNGVKAQAKVLKVWDTGVTLNDDPTVGLLLEVSPPGGSPFQAEGKALVSRLRAALVQPGVTAEVVYDPQKPSRLQVTTLHLEAAEAGPLDPAARLERLEELREKGLISAAEYQEKRLEILKEL